jgi:hypothetical protein
MGQAETDGEDVPNEFLEELGNRVRELSRKLSGNSSSNFDSSTQGSSQLFKPT